MSPLHPLFWHWWVLGLLLMALEAFAPGAFFLWMGVSALVLGSVLFVLPGIAIEWQIFIFAVLAVGSVVAWRRWRGQNNEPQLQTPLNDRARMYMGRTFTLDSPIVNGVGQLRVDDGQWRASGPDLDAGRKVIVIAVDGATLKVKAAD